jgi:hypothetical protein
MPVNLQSEYGHGERGVQVRAVGVERAEEQEGRGHRGGSGVQVGLEPTGGAGFAARDGRDAEGVGDGTAGGRVTRASAASGIVMVSGEPFERAAVLPVSSRAGPAETTPSPVSGADPDSEFGVNRYL